MSNSEVSKRVSEKLGYNVEEEIVRKIRQYVNISRLHGVCQMCNKKIDCSFDMLEHLLLAENLARIKVKLMEDTKKDVCKDVIMAVMSEVIYF